LSPLRLEKTEYSRLEYEQSSYAQNPINTQVIEGYFQKEVSQKALAIKRINKTLCAMLGVAVLAAFVSYYFAMSDELTLNKLSRQITALNDENSELQNNLDRLKSFNNVDDKMIENNTLVKAQKVIEVPAVMYSEPAVSNSVKTASFDWAIGY